MKKLIFKLAVFCGCLFLTGCATCDSEENIPAATVEQTAAVFNEVIARDNCDIVMCHLVKSEHATCGTAIRNVIMCYDWYEVIYSVKNFLMTGDKFVICQHIDSPLETDTPDYRTYNNSEVVYFEIDKDYASISDPVTALTGNRYYIWMTGGPIGDLLNPAVIGQEYDYTPNAREAFFKAACRRLSEAQLKNCTILTRAARKLHKWSVSGTSSQATTGSDFTSKASGIW
jgi:hypothetical protein